METTNFGRSVGVVVCTYRKPDQLRRALKSVAIQNYRNYSIVVIDDCSDCADINKRICSEFGSNVIYRLSARNHGISVSRNIGLKHFVDDEPRDLICMLDDDDEWPSGRISYGVDAMGPRVGMSYGIQIMVDEARRPIHAFPCNTSFLKCQLHAFCFGEFFFPAKTYMFNRTFLKELSLGGSKWYIDFNSREDVELGVRALRYAGRSGRWQVAFIDRLLAYWIQPSREKFFRPEYRLRQAEVHAYLVRQYLPEWLQGIAIETAPLSRRLPDWMKFGLF
jgi:glycosyltransferase involved in cell wall biosynthesis